MAICKNCNEEFPPRRANQKACKETKTATCPNDGATYSYICGDHIPKTCGKKSCHTKSKTYCKTCTACGDEFAAKSTTAKFCRKPTTKTCPVDETEFEIICGKEKLFCSRRCEGSTKPNGRTCELCADPLTGAQQRYCKAIKQRNCDHCGSSYEYECFRQVSSFCDLSCAGLNKEVQEKRSKTNLERYGVENIFQDAGVRERALVASQTSEAQQKKIKTNLERFGAEYPAQNPALNAEYLRRQREKNNGKLGFNTEKQKQTMLERYGVDHPMKSREIIERSMVTQRKNNNGKLAFNTEKQRETMLERYGSLGSLGDPAVFERQKQTMLDRYGVERPNQLPEFAQKAMEKIIENNGVLFGDSTISKLNKSFAENVEKEFGVVLEFEKRLGRFFYDLASDEHKVLIDLNPTVTHNSTIPFACLRNKCDVGCESHTPIASTYHQSRAKVAREHGYTLVQVYDWTPVDGVMGILAAKLGQPQRKLSARKLIKKRITQKEANRFFDSEHIQGGSKKQTHCYGLFDGDELVVATSFGPSRFSKDYEYEWIRHAVKKGVRVHGAPGMLYKMFLADADPNSVMSYVDFDHTTRDTFLDSIGFERVGLTSPSIMWSKGKKVVSQNSLVRLGADRVLGTSYGPREICGMNNEEIMLAEGYLKVYTAGNAIYGWQRP